MFRANTVLGCFAEIFAHWECTNTTYYDFRVAQPSTSPPPATPTPNPSLFVMWVPSLMHLILSFSKQKCMYWCMLWYQMQHYIICDIIILPCRCNTTVIFSCYLWQHISSCMNNTFDSLTYMLCCKPNHSISMYLERVSTSDLINNRFLCAVDTFVHRNIPPVIPTDIIITFLSCRSFSFILDAYYPDKQTLCSIQAGIL